MKSTFTLKKSAKAFLLTMFLLIASIKTFAYDFAIDGICYNIQSKTYRTCNVSGYTELTNNNLIIPSRIKTTVNTTSALKVVSTMRKWSISMLAICLKELRMSISINSCKNLCP